jgi:hypothetical protein
MAILPSSYLLISILISYNPYFNNVKSNILVFIVSCCSFLLFLFVPDNSIIEVSTFYGPYKQQCREAIKYVVDNYDKKSIILSNRSPDILKYYIQKFNKDNGKLNIKYLNKLKPLKFYEDKYNRIFILLLFTKPDSYKEINSKKSHFKCDIKEFRDILLYDCHKRMRKNPDFLEKSDFSVSSKNKSEQ